MPGLATFGELLHQLIGIEVLVSAENLIDQRQTLLRHAHPPALQEFDKPIARRERNGNVLEIGRHSHSCIHCKEIDGEEVDENVWRQLIETQNR